MLHCKNCDIDIGGAPERCPLCQGGLTGEPDVLGGAFIPMPTDKNRRDLIFRIITFAAVAGAVISLAVDYMIGGNISWSLFVLAGCVSGWMFAAVGWRGRYALSRTILSLTVIVCLSGLFWDWILGWKGWSIDYVIPCACVAAIAALGVLAIVLRMPSEEYIAYLLCEALLGLVPAVLFFTGCVKIIYPSVICAVVCLLSLVTLFLFYRRSTVGELNKKLHL